MTECLVRKAQQECQCEWCKSMREWRNILLMAELNFLGLHIFKMAFKEKQEVLV